MIFKRIAPLFLCLAVGLVAYVMLDFWSARNAPLYVKFGHQWKADVERLEASGRLPAPWFQVGEVEITGGTPETKSWLKRIEIPVRTKVKNGPFKLEVLVVAWEEDGKRGALVQYNMVDVKSRNMIWELGRTLILSRPDDDSLSLLLESLRQ